MGVPYLGDGTDGKTRHQFVDLRADPGAIRKFPEIQEAPEFVDFLLAVNGSKTKFRTLGCDQLTSLFNHPDVKSKRRGYVGVAFAEWIQNRHLEQFYLLAGDFCKFLEQREDEKKLVLEIKFVDKAFYLDPEFSGWSVDF